MIRTTTLNRDNKRKRGQGHVSVGPCFATSERSFSNSCIDGSNKRFKSCCDVSRGKVFLSPTPTSADHDDHDDHDDEHSDRGDHDDQDSHSISSLECPLQEDDSHSNVLREGERTLAASPNPATCTSTCTSNIEQESNIALSQLLRERHARQKSEDELSKAPIDLAWHFVENVIDRREKIQTSPRKSSLITTIAEDELYFLVQNFLACRDSFIEKGMPTNVTIGYHYTRQRCADGIRQNGLMESSNGTFGKGIYLGNNPLAFHGRGNMGLLVVILKGKSKRVNRENSRHSDVRSSNNTLIGNKLERFNSSSSSSIPTFWDEIVLQQSCQCIPLLRFDASLVDRSGNPSSRGNDILWHYHREMQRVLDLFFNNGEITKIEKSDIFPIPPPPQVVRAPRVPFHNHNQQSSHHPSSGLPIHHFYLTSTTNGNWQSSKDMDHRRKMIHDIVRLCKTSGSSKLLFSKEMQDTTHSFPMMVKALEVNLYRLSYSFEAYADRLTLEYRLEEMTTRLKKKKDLWGQGGLFLINNNHHNFERPTIPNHSESIIYQAPKDMDTFLDESKEKLLPSNSSHSCDAECVICLSTMDSDDNDDIVKINVTGCNHVFHRGCIEKALQVKPCCPICRRLVSEPRGASPSGRMTITNKMFYCAGFETNSSGAIEIKYEMHSNFQKEYHPNPGVFFLGTERVAYLPYNEEGLQLLKRLKYAWSRGLTFAVGNSLTTGKPNSITWGSIHHKTNVSGGTRCHGFPDGGYFVNCNADLDALGVPKAIDC